MNTLEKCIALSDHPLAFEYMYEEILATARVLSDSALFCEIGTREGGSALLALSAIKDSGSKQLMITVDPYGGKPYYAVNCSLPYDNWYEDTFYRTMMREISSFCDEHDLNHAHFKITSFEFMDTFESLHLWKDQSILKPLFGYVYLDGEHTPEAVSKELSWFLPRLLNNGLLIIDDIENLAVSNNTLIQEILTNSVIKGNRAFYRKAVNFQEKNLVLTIAIGDDYKELAKITHPTIQAYATRIDADFLVITETKQAQTTPHWEKFQIYNLLDTYKRILYVDTDIIIRKDCPDLFTLVPERELGMFNEGPFTDRSRELLIDTCKAYGKTLPSWDGRYFNSGVMVVSQRHKHLFIKPEKEIFNFYEQTYLNMLLAASKTDMFELPYKFNRMTCVDSSLGEHRLASYIVHYAGAPNSEIVTQLAKKDRQVWKSMKGVYTFQRHIHISVTGGLGDQVSAEPAIRYMTQYIYPHEDIVVSTHFPELFAHLPVRVYQHGEFQPEFDTSYYCVNSLPPPESITWHVVSNLLCHTVDYCSIALLKRTLPMEDKRVHLSLFEEDEEYILRTVFNEGIPKKFIAVHAGLHWNTKTFPTTWWQRVVDLLDAEGFTVCLIGKDEETRGVLPVVCPENGIDLRNGLSLGQLIALLRYTPLLISNDSSPIHIAGAFENAIILIPSCKHPEHILPYRHGSMYWRARAPYKRLTLDDVSSCPTEIHGSSAEFEVEDWSRYLPDPHDVLINIELLKEENVLCQRSRGDVT